MDTINTIKRAAVSLDICQCPTSIIDPLHSLEKILRIIRPEDATPFEKFRCDLTNHFDETLSSVPFIFEPKQKTIWIVQIRHIIPKDIQENYSEKKVKDSSKSKKQPRSITKKKIIIYSQRDIDQLDMMADLFHDLKVRCLDDWKVINNLSVPLFPCNIPRIKVAEIAKDQLDKSLMLASLGSLVGGLGAAAMVKAMPGLLGLDDLPKEKRQAIEQVLILSGLIIGALPGITEWYKQLKLKIPNEQDNKNTPDKNFQLPEPYYYPPSTRNKRAFVLPSSARLQKWPGLALHRTMFEKQAYYQVPDWFHRTVSVTNICRSNADTTDIALLSALVKTAQIHLGDTTVASVAKILQASGMRPEASYASSVALSTVGDKNYNKTYHDDQIIRGVTEWWKLHDLMEMQNANVNILA